MIQIDDMSNTEGGFGTRGFNATTDGRQSPGGVRLLPLDDDVDDEGSEEDDYESDFEPD